MNNYKLFRNKITSHVPLLNRISIILKYFLKGKVYLFIYVVIT